MPAKKLFAVFIPWIIIWILGSSCAEKMICPAYQSAFIYDTAALRKKFSYFVNDTPKITKVNKNKFLLIEPVSYRKTLASFRTIEMLPIYPVIPDSLKFSGDAQMVAERDIVDSTGTVQEPLHPGLIGPKFNVEQENYMYYFRKILVLPDVRGDMSASGTRAKKQGFFSRIFKRKKKAEVDPTSADETPEKKNFFQRIFSKKKSQAEVEPDSGTSTTAEESKPEKKNFFQRIFGKKKKATAEEEKKEEEKKKAANEGFQ